MLRFTLLFFALSACGSAPLAVAHDYNQEVLDAVRAMPDGGSYSQTVAATVNLGKSIFNQHGLISEAPAVASPVYCSGATYQAFIYTIGRLQASGLALSIEAVNGLLVHLQNDGTDSWGRWNANGPGTARLFYELGLGLNTMDWAQARPGDFMKIFYTDQIGKFERGHSVVYLGVTHHDDADYVSFWSSDEPNGRGTYEMPKSKIYQAVFSRLEHPEALNNIPAMPQTDPYLASLLTTASTLDEMKEKIGIK